MVLNESVSKKRGRQLLRWKDCIKTGVRKTEDDDKSEKAADRESWKGITAGSVQQYMN